MSVFSEITDFRPLASIFAALGSPTRMAILYKLLDHPISVLPLSDTIGEKQSNVSQQLRRLKQAGLVTRVRTGATTTYSVNKSEIEHIFNVASHLSSKIASQKYEMFCSAKK